MFSDCCWEDYREEITWGDRGYFKVTNTCYGCKEMCSLISQKDINKQLKKRLEKLKPVSHK